MSRTKKDSFVFYRSFFEALKNVPKKHRTEIYDAVFMYAFESQEPSLSGVPRALWELIKPQLDASERRYENAKKNGEYGKMGAEYGKKGGRPKKEKTPLRGISENPLNVNVNENVNDNENVNVNVNGEEPDTPSTQPEPVENSVDHQTEVADYYRGYCILKGYRERENFVERFLSYRHGDWKSDVRSWADKDAKTDRVNRQSGSRGKTKFHNFEQRDPGDFDPYAMGLFANN